MSKETTLHRTWYLLKCRGTRTAHNQTGYPSWKHTHIYMISIPSMLNALMKLATSQSVRQTFGPPTLSSLADARSSSPVPPEKI